MENNSVHSNTAPTGGTKYSKDQTVEAYLNSERDRLLADIDDHAKLLVSKLKEEYTALKSAFLEQVKAYEPQSSTKDTLHVELQVMEGAYEGKSFSVYAKAGGKVVMVGRSRGKKFTAAGTGISLYKDKEVSTTHGKFEVEEGAAEETEQGEMEPKLVFTDVGSTNGTEVNGKAIESNKKVPISVGDIIKIGTNLIKVASIRAK